MQNDYTSQNRATFDESWSAEKALRTNLKSEEWPNRLKLLLTNFIITNFCNIWTTSISISQNEAHSTYYKHKTYGNYDYSVFGEREAKDLVIQFDDNGVVTTYTFSTTEHKE